MNLFSDYNTNIFNFLKNKISKKRFFQVRLEESKLNLMTLLIYGSLKTVKVLVLDDFLWRKDAYDLRFVLVIDQDKKLIFACTDHSLSVQEILEAYSVRFQIEVSFKYLKELFETFAARFHCQTLKPFKMRAKKGTPGSAAHLKGHELELFLASKRAHERYVLASMQAYYLGQLYQVNKMLWLEKVI